MDMYEKVAGNDTKVDVYNRIPGEGDVDQGEGDISDVFDDPEYIPSGGSIISNDRDEISDDPTWLCEDLEGDDDDTLWWQAWHEKDDELCSIRGSSDKEDQYPEFNEDVHMKNPVLIVGMKFPSPVSAASNGVSTATTGVFAASNGGRNTSAATNGVVNGVSAPSTSTTSQPPPIHSEQRTKLPTHGAKSVQHNARGRARAGGHVGPI
ncbi:unnamed protein product [Ilex paraguariensis]|uniref:Uncharacterized protein n=1 Tax=Ilex paraguariensis TaxID=185542 RepID=A0ABC8UCP1_9AQUA